MFRDLRARLCAARFLLESANDARGEAISRTQSEAFIALLARAQNLSEGEQLELSDLALSVRWCETDKKAVMDALWPDKADEIKVRSRPSSRQMQTFLGLADMLTEGDWAILNDPNPSDLRKREVLIMRALSLGCRRPSEPTLKRWTVLWILITAESSQAIDSISNDRKRTMLSFFKAEFHHVKQHSPLAPEEPIVQYPSAPEEFARKYPSQYKAAYGTNDNPVKSKVDVWKIASLEAASSKTLQLALNPASQNNGLECFATCVVEGLRSMQQSQQDMMQYMMGRSQRPSRSLAALSDVASRSQEGSDAGELNLQFFGHASRSQLGAHSMPAQDSWSLPALRDGASPASQSELRADASEFQRQGDQQSSQSQLNATPAECQPQSQLSAGADLEKLQQQPQQQPQQQLQQMSIDGCTPGATKQTSLHAASPAVADAAALLDALQQREDEKKEAKKKANAEKRTAAAADKAAAKAEKRTAEAADKAAAKAAAAKQKELKSKAKAKSAAKDCIQMKDADGRMTETYKEARKAQALRTGVGCSKCRYSDNGCGKCRRPKPTTEDECKGKGKKHRQTRG